MATHIFGILTLIVIKIIFCELIGQDQPDDKLLTCSPDAFQELDTEILKIFLLDQKFPGEKMTTADYEILLEFRVFLSLAVNIYERCRPTNDTNQKVLSSLWNFFLTLEMHPAYYEIASTATILNYMDSDCNFYLKNLTNRIVIEHPECFEEKFESIVSLIRNLASNEDFWKTLELYANLSRKSTIDCSKFMDNTSLGDYHPNVWLRREAPQYLLDCVRSKRIDPLIPPLPPFSKITTKFYLIPLSLLSLNNDGELSLFSAIEVIWKDPRRLWNSAQLPIFTRLHPHELWHPNLWIDRCFTENCLVAPGNFSYITLMNIGYAAYSHVMKIGVICDFQLDEFPFDNQSCVIKIFPNEIDVELAVPLIKGSIPEFPMEEWEFLNFTGRPTFFTIQNSLGIDLNLSTYEYILQVKRNPEYYMQNLLLPIILISILGACCILLPADSDELQFAVTIFLGFFFLQTIVASIIPKDAGIPKIGIYVIIALCQSAINSASVVIVMGIKKISHPRVPPFWITLIFIRIIGIFVLVDIKNTFKFWSRKLGSKDSHDSPAGINPELRLEAHEESQSLELNRKANVQKGEQGRPMENETEDDARNDVVNGVISGGREKPTWWTVARVVDRLVGIIHIIIALANFFFVLFPLLLLGWSS